ncbi:MAG: radical SAM protein [Deltaproteobacteria bacterium]|nr:radical SAM protein [Deltaproteobacteria bacterium]
MALLVNEIFFSIQGESLFSGLATVFVRLGGCNLKCSYCDTKYAWQEGKTIDTDEIVKRVSSYKCGLVEITGGEPLLQDETPRLIYILLEKGYKVLLETNGSIDIKIVDDRCIKIVDIKCPASGESNKNNMINLKRLTCNDQVKFVITDRHDYDYAKKIIKLTKTDFPKGNILFSPVTGLLPLERLAAWMLQDNMQVRLHIQLHKFIWPGMERGV